MDMLQARQQADLIYVRAQVTAYNRKRLIEQKVPFIVPGNQMYLPMLAIDLREHFRRIREEAPTSARPRRLWSSMRCSAMQGGADSRRNGPAVGILGHDDDPAFDQLEAANLAEVTVRAGSVVCVSLEAKRDMGEGSALLRSP